MSKMSIMPRVLHLSISVVVARLVQCMTCLLPSLLTGTEVLSWSPELYAFMRPAALLFWMAVMEHAGVVTASSSRSQLDMLTMPNLWVLGSETILLKLCASQSLTLKSREIMREEPKMETWLIREARGTSLHLWQFWFKASTDGFSVQINPWLLERAHLLQRHHAETVARNCPSRTRRGEWNKWCVPPPVNQRWRASAVTSRRTNGRHAGELIFSSSLHVFVGRNGREKENKCQMCGRQRRSPA